MAHETTGDESLSSHNQSIFEDPEPTVHAPRGNRLVLLAQPLASAAGPVKRANGHFQPLAPAAPQPTLTAATTVAAPWSQLLLLYVVGLLVIVLDQASKLVIERVMEIGEHIELIPGLAPYFQLTRTLNRGAAFGMFQNGGIIFSIVAVVVAIIIIVYNHQLPAGQNWLRLALGMQLGGALGNFIDRLRQGYVTDFLDINVESLIDFPYANWPIFNFADMAIVGGVVVLVIVMIFIDEEALNPPTPANNEAAASTD